MIVEKLNKNDVLLVMESTGFLFLGSTFEGYLALHPYKRVGLMLRILREFVFKFIPFLGYLFYNKEVFNGKWKYILIWDPLVSRQFIKKVHAAHPQAQINFIYWNMVGRCRHLHPSHIPIYVRKWTYDNYDSKRYGLRLYTTYPYYKLFVKENQTVIYDVLFVGKDKGRADFLIELENNLKEKGLSTKFIITKTDRLSRNKKIYSKEVDYMTLCNLISQSRAVLNVVMDNQEGLTLRDLEYVFQRVKLITTNKKIKKNSIYHPNNVFVLGDDNFDDIIDFLDCPYQTLPSYVIKHHEFDSFIHEIICAD